MNAPTEPDFLALRHGMKYLTHNPQEPIMYSGNNIFKVNDISHQCLFKLGDAEKKNKEYYNFLHTYCNTDNQRDFSNRSSVTWTYHLFNGASIYWCTKKQSKTYTIILNEETI